MRHFEVVGQEDVEGDVMGDVMGYDPDEARSGGIRRQR